MQIQNIIFLRTGKFLTPDLNLTLTDSPKIIFDTSVEKSNI